MVFFLSYSDGELSAKPKNLLVEEGKTATFTCESEVIPSIPVFWIKKDRVCDDIGCRTSEKRVSDMDNKKFKETNGVLKILNVEPEDRGTWACQRILGQRFESDSVYLNITSK